MMCWREVNGLESLKTALSSSKLVHFDRRFKNAWKSHKAAYGRGQKLIDILPGARLCNSGVSNIVLFWDVIEGGGRLEIWSADISLERRQGGEIWGNIERSNAVKTVDHFLGHDYKEWRNLNLCVHRN